MNFWENFVQRYRGSVIANIHSNYVDRLEISKSEFAEAKIISDVVGMILRMAFCMSSGFYFYRKVASTDRYVLIFVFSTCMVASIWLLTALNARFTVMTHAYLVGRTKIPDNIIGKLIFILLTFNLLISLNVGFFFLIKDVSNNLIR